MSWISELVPAPEADLDQVPQRRRRQSLGRDPGRGLGLYLQRPEAVVGHVDVLDARVRAELAGGGLDEIGDLVALRELDADGAHEVAHLLSTAGGRGPSPVCIVMVHRLGSHVDPGESSVLHRQHPVWILCAKATEPGWTAGNPPPASSPRLRITLKNSL